MELNDDVRVSRGGRAFRISIRRVTTRNYGQDLVARANRRMIEFPTKCVNRNRPANWRPVKPNISPWFRHETSETAGEVL